MRQWLTCTCTHDWSWHRCTPDPVILLEGNRISAALTPTTFANKASDSSGTSLPTSVPETAGNHLVHVPCINPANARPPHASSQSWHPLTVTEPWDPLVVTEPLDDGRIAARRCCRSSCPGGRHSADRAGECSSYATQQECASLTQALAAFTGEQSAPAHDVHGPGDDLRVDDARKCLRGLEHHNAPVVAALQLSCSSMRAIWGWSAHTLICSPHSMHGGARAKALRRLTVQVCRHSQPA